MSFGKDNLCQDVDGATLLLRSYNPSEEKGKHVHDGATFFMPVCGGFEERCGRRTYGVGTLQVAAQTQNVEHSTAVCRDGMRALFVELPDSWLMRRQIAPASRGSYSVATGGRALAMIRLVAALVEREEQAVLEEMLLRLCDVPECHEAGRPSWLKAAEDLIEARYDERLSLANIAAEVGIHPVHLARVFRRRHGCTVGNYVRTVRVTAALRLAGHTSLADAAASSGFADQSHLCRSVKQELARRPSEIVSLMATAKEGFNHSMQLENRRD